MTTSEELAYAAGFFDGEGHIRIVQHSKKTRCTMLQVSVTQATEKPLDQFVRAFGGTLHRRMVGYKGIKKVRYDWQSSNGVAERFLRAVLPFLRNKADEAAVALEYRDRVVASYAKHRNSKLSNEEISVRVGFGRRLKDIRAEKHAGYMADGNRAYAGS